MPGKRAVHRFINKALPVLDARADRKPLCAKRHPGTVQHVKRIARTVAGRKHQNGCWHRAAIRQRSRHAAAALLKRSELCAKTHFAAERNNAFPYIFYN